MLLLNLDDTISTNLFAYCYNEPINSVDSTGNSSKKDGWYEYYFTFSYHFLLVFLAGLDYYAIGASRIGKLDDFFYYIDRCMEVLNEVVPPTIYISALFECLKGFVRILNYAAYREITKICKLAPSEKQISHQMASMTIYMLDGCHGQQVKFVFKNYMGNVTRTVKYRLHYITIYSSYLYYIQHGLGFRCSRRRVGMFYKY